MPADCRDGFFCSYWKRPEAYLDPGVCACISVLTLVGDRVLQPALRRLENDLRSRAWADRNRALLDLDSYDWGYRLVTCES